LACIVIAATPLPAQSLLALAKDVLYRKLLTLF